MKTPTWILSLLLILIAVAAEGEGVSDLDPPQCGPLAGGQRCRDGFCCSKWGFCGTTDAYCSEINCESQCPTPPTPLPPPILPPPPWQPLSSIFPETLFEEFLKHRNDPRCNGRGFYTYDAFLEAVRDYPDFGNTGNLTVRKGEIAAFFGLTSSFTDGGWTTSDGKYATGYCRKVSGNTSLTHCRSSLWPCAPGKKYYSRGPMVITGNDNYGRYGDGMGLDLISDPDVVENDPVIAFKTALWRWMTPSEGRPPRPSSHAVMTGRYVPSPTDLEANRLPGFGTTINILAPSECGRPAHPNSIAAFALGYYKRYCDIFGIDYGDNIDCSNQRSYWDGIAFI